MGNRSGKKKEKVEAFQICREHEDSINCMDVSEDGSLLATGSDEGTIRLWTTQTMPVECVALLEGHEDYITSLLIEGAFVLSSSADSTIRKWDIASTSCVLIFHGHESIVNRTVSTGDFLFSVSYDKTARCWDLDTGEQVRLFSGHSGNIVALLFMPADNQQTLEGMQMVKQLEERKKLAAKGNKLPPIGVDPTAQAAQDAAVQDDIYNRDQIVTGSFDALAKSWSIETGECLKTFRGHTGPITCLATDPSGKMLFTGSADNTIRSWDIITGVSLKLFAEHKATILSLYTEGKLLYSTSTDHTARCWVMDTANCTRVYQGADHSVITLVEANGLIYTGSGDSLIRCFDAKSGALKRTFKGHSGLINCLRVVDGRLFSGSFDSTLRIWTVSDLRAEDDPGKEKNKDDEDPLAEP